MKYGVIIPITVEVLWHMFGKQPRPWSFNIEELVERLKPEIFEQLEIEYDFNCPIYIDGFMDLTKDILMIRLASFFPYNGLYQVAEGQEYPWTSLRFNNSKNAQ